MAKTARATRDRTAGEGRRGRPRRTVVVAYLVERGLILLTTGVARWARSTSSCATATLPALRVLAEQLEQLGDGQRPVPSPERPGQGTGRPVRLAHAGA